MEPLGQDDPAIHPLQDKNKLTSVYMDLTYDIQILQNSQPQMSRVDTQDVSDLDIWNKDKMMMTQTLK